LNNRKKKLWREAAGPNATVVLIWTRQYNILFVYQLLREGLDLFGTGRDIYIIIIIIIIIFFRLWRR
jgi:hypothetical protein